VCANFGFGALAGICDRCGSRHWNADAEAIIEESVRREYEKLPSAKT